MTGTIRTTVDSQTQGVLYARYRQLRTRELLAAAPDLVSHVLAQMVPGGGVTGAAVSGTRDVPLPLNATALEDANRVYTGLMRWAMGHAVALRVQPPAIALGYLRMEEPPTGLPSWATPTDAQGMVHSLVDWLCAYEDAIATRADVAVYWDDVNALIGPVLRRWLPEARKPSQASRSCPLCARRTMIVDYDDDSGEVSVACTYCGYTVPHAYRLKYLEWKRDENA